MDETRLLTAEYGELAEEERIAAVALAERHGRESAMACQQARVERAERERKPRPRPLGSAPADYQVYVIEVCKNRCVTESIRAHDATLEHRAIEFAGRWARTLLRDKRFDDPRVLAFCAGWESFRAEALAAKEYSRAWK